MTKHIKIKLKRSYHGAKPNHRKSVMGLGLRRMHQERVVQDTPAVRGMIQQIPYLVEILEENVSAPAGE